MSAIFGPVDFQAASGATQAQMDDLESYRALLQDWNGRMNLVGPSALNEFWLRHAWDSAQLHAYAPAADVWADVGAGAGFPGLVLAVLLKGRAGATVHLIESMAKRCRFLSEVVDRLALPAVVHNARGEDTHLKDVDVVTARACAPMIKLLEFAEPLFDRGATGLFLKGKDAPAEIVEAKKVWRLSVSLFPSRSNPEGNIVKVEGVSRV
jgi:16S rRNA (guanine527-N7)-methyltransferase